MRLKRERRDDVFSPASSSHFLHFFLPFIWPKLSETDYVSKSNNYEYLLGSLDIKDAFLQVAQEEP